MAIGLLRRFDCYLFFGNSFLGTMLLMKSYTRRPSNSPTTPSTPIHIDSTSTGVSDTREKHFFVSCFSYMMGFLTERTSFYMYLVMYLFFNIFAVGWDFGAIYMFVVDRIWGIWFLEWYQMSTLVGMVSRVLR